jgi:hypothetical protein
MLQSRLFRVKAQTKTDHSYLFLSFLFFVPQVPPAHLDTIFAKMDVDKDGQISAEEFTQYVTGLDVSRLNIATRIDMKQMP